MILHVFMLQIIYTTVFQVKQLNNLTLHVRLFNSENGGINITYVRLINGIKYIKHTCVINQWNKIYQACVINQWNKIYQACVINQWNKIYAIFMSSL